MEIESEQIHHPEQGRARARGPNRARAGPGKGRENSLGGKDKGWNAGVRSSKVSLDLRAQLEKRGKS